MLLAQLSQDPKIQELMSGIADELKPLAEDENIRQIWKIHPFHPLVRDQFHSGFAERLQEMADAMKLESDPAKVQLGILLSKELRENEDLYVRFLVETMVDSVWNRTAGAAESKNIDDLLKPVDIRNFREFYHRICFVKSVKLAKICEMAGFERGTNDDGVILYGYIDQSRGLSFMAVCCAHIGKDNSIHHAKVGENISFRISAETLADAVYLNLLNTNCDMFEFIPTVEHAMHFEENNPNITNMRIVNFGLRATSARSFSHTLTGK